MLFAEIIAVGPFKRALISHYEYPAELYARTNEGAPAIRRMFGIVEGTTVGTAFANALGIDDPWDFNQHAIDARKINFDALRTILSTLEDAEDHLKDLKALQAFAGEGYDLYFLPNA